MTPRDFAGMSPAERRRAVELSEGAESKAAALGLLDLLEDLEAKLAGRAPSDREPMVIGFNYACSVCLGQTTSHCGHCQHHSGDLHRVFLCRDPVCAAEHARRCGCGEGREAYRSKWAFILEPAGVM